mgnify:CR=1 FL=1
MKRGKGCLANIVAGVVFLTVFGLLFVGIIMIFNVDFSASSERPNTIFFIVPFFVAVAVANFVRSMIIKDEKEPEVKNWTTSDK